MCDGRDRPNIARERKLREREAREKKDGAPSCSLTFIHQAAGVIRFPLRKGQVFQRSFLFQIVVSCSLVCALTAFYDGLQANQKQFMDSVKSRDIQKVTKWLNKGIDPNFHQKETGGERKSFSKILHSLASKDIFRKLVGAPVKSFTFPETSYFCFNDCIRTLQLSIDSAPNTSKMLYVSSE